MSNETLALLKSRRSIRKFKAQQVSDAELNTVLEAATYAPSGKGAQASIIISVQNAEDLATLRKMNAAILGVSSDPYYDAPTIVLVLADRARPTRVEDASCVLTYIMVAAAAIGLGTCWINREQQMFDSEEGKALLKKWGVTGDYVGVGACALGYPEGPASQAALRKADYITHVR